MYLTHRQLKTRKRIKRGLLFILLLFIGWISFGIYLTINKTDNKKLEDIGYSNIEINIIEDILNNKQIKILYNYEYIDILTDLLVEKDFNSKKLKNYIEYYNNYKNIKMNDLLYIINNNLDEMEYNKFNMEIINYENFDLDKMDRYKEYNDKYDLKIEEVIDAVNNNFDEYDIEYDKKYLKYIDKDYCILKNLKRYDNYKNNHKEKTIEEVIAEVNSNLDKKDTKKTNTDKGIQIIVNKYYYLSKDYTPDNLVNIDPKMGKGRIEEETYNAYKNMYEDAKTDNVNLFITRGYTSYNEQSGLYYKNKYFYAKPGHSEFQTGLMIELSTNSWLEENAYKYGFILRYPEEKKHITGFYMKNYYRYVGEDIAKFIHENKISYEEYYAFFINQN